MDHIMLTTAISGKSFVLDAFLAGIKSLLRCNPSMHWVICDTSGNDSIKSLLYACAESADCKFTYTSFFGGPKYEEYAQRDTLKTLIEYMPRLYNHMMSHVPECDFVLNVEDDIIPAMANPVSLLRNGFDGTTAAVVWVTFNRRLTSHLGRLQGSLRKADTEGYSEIKRTAFGLIMMKYEYSQMGFAGSLGSVVAFDNVFGAKVEHLGKKIKIAWGVRTRHYFNTKNGDVSYVG